MDYAPSLNVLASESQKRQSIGCLFYFTMFDYQYFALI